MKFDNLKWHSARAVIKAAALAGVSVNEYMKTKGLSFYGGAFYRKRTI